MERDYSGELLRFIQEHPSVYHVIEGQRRILLEARLMRAPMVA